MYDQILKRIKKENLTQKEKEVGLLLVKDFIKNHPIQTAVIEDALPKISNDLIKSPYFNMYWMNQKATSYASVFLLFILVTSGTLFAAKSSLPGDILYPIKINVSEKLESFVALGKKAQIDVQVGQTISRLEEAEVLSNQNRLDEKKKTKIRDNFVSKSAEISRQVSELRGKGDTKNATEIDNKFVKSLEKHRSIISKITDTGEGTSTTTAGVKVKAGESTQNSTTTMERNSKEKKNDSDDKTEDLQTNNEHESQVDLLIDPPKIPTRPTVTTPPTIPKLR